MVAVGLTAATGCADTTEGVIVIGGGPSWPVDFDWIRVWQQ